MRLLTIWVTVPEAPSQKMTKEMLMPSVKLTTATRVEATLRDKSALHHVMKVTQSPSRITEEA